MRGYIQFVTLVNDNHVDNYLKHILAFVYYGSIVNNRPKNTILYIIILEMGGKKKQVELKFNAPET